jgi:hypothetical protein
MGSAARPACVILSAEPRLSHHVQGQHHMVVCCVIKGQRQRCRRELCHSAEGGLDANQSIHLITQPSHSPQTSDDRKPNGTRRLHKDGIIKYRNTELQPGNLTGLFHFGKPLPAYSWVIDAIADICPE